MGLPSSPSFLYFSLYHLLFSLFPSFLPTLSPGAHLRTLGKLSKGQGLFCLVFAFYSLFLSAQYLLKLLEVVSFINLLR